MVKKSMQRIRRTWIWLRRIRHCRGFGVQSPWAYRIVRYVINEHWSYYAYDTLRRKYPDAGVIDRKLCELCLRLANHVQPLLMVNIDTDCRISGEYMKAGYRRAKYLEVTAADYKTAMKLPTGNDDAAKLIRIVPQDNLEQIFDTACSIARHGTVIMLQGIHEDATARRLWTRTLAERPHVVTFDLYYCGLIFFDDKHFKQNYIINF